MPSCRVRQPHRFHPGFPGVNASSARLFTALHPPSPSETKQFPLAEGSNAGSVIAWSQRDAPDALKSAAGCPFSIFSAPGQCKKLTFL
jgi:hypothetical protein